MSLAEQSQTVPETINLNIKKPISLWRSWPVASLMVVVAISFVGVGLISPLRTLYARSEGVSGGEAGLMGAAFLFSGFVFLFPFGWLSDRVNRTWLVIAGLIGHALITIGYLPATSAEMFITLRFLEGITAAAVLSPARAMLAELTPNGRGGEAFGMLSAMMTFGMFAGPPIGTFMAEMLGYAPVYVLASLVFIPAILMMFFAFRGYKPEKISRDKPLTTAEIAENRPSEKLLTGPVIVGCIVKAAIGLGPGIAIAIWALFAADLGFSLSLIGWTYTVYAVPMVLVAPSAGRFSDRFGRLWMMFGGALLLALLWVSYGFITSFIVFMILGIVEGSIDAVARSANDGYLADHSPASRRGQAQGLYNAVQQFGTLVGALLGGFLYEIMKGGSFAIIGGIQFSLVAIALLLALFLRRKPASDKAVSY